MAGMHVRNTFPITLVDIVQHLPRDLSPFAEFFVAQRAIENVTFTLF